MAGEALKNAGLELPVEEWKQYSGLGSLSWAGSAFLALFLTNTHTRTHTDVF